MGIVPVLPVRIGTGIGLGESTLSFEDPNVSA
jgi:hypothetical protein